MTASKSELRRLVAQTAIPKITEFQGNYRWLSNFWPCEVHYDNFVFPSSEHAYQAAKTYDAKLLVQIRDAATPALAKRLGRLIPDDMLKPGWEDRKVDVMREIMRDKFTRNRALREALVVTGDALLEEGNWWGDRFWGVSPANSGNGLNHLGKILMSVRSEIRREIFG